MHRLCSILVVFFPATPPPPPAALRQGNTPELRLSGSISREEDQVLRSIAEPAARSLSRTLGIPWTRPLRIEVYRSDEELPPELRSVFGTHTAAVMLLGRDRMILPIHRAERAPSTLATVVEHELVHALLDQLPAEVARKIPRWLHEGYAQSWTERIHGGGSVDEVAFRVVTGGLSSFRELAEEFPADANAVRLAYAQSFSFVHFLRKRLGDARLMRAIRALDGSRDFDEAFAKSEGGSILVEETAWMEDLRRGGATWRFLQENCFLYLMLVAALIGFAALARKVRRDASAARRLLEADEREWPHHAGGEAGEAWAESGPDDATPDQGLGDGGSADHGSADDGPADDAGSRR